ncbi:Cro/CI family transcriptional regulator [Pseudomonas chlororaphis]|uniref:Cro/CI family transcriptional regulator n=1 Tax=Pseudomonas chlororaphis TaxID=587753 RepID=UPI00236831B0|nr:Cro/CI family transcriptional regulator [Pseudomonas chlororaphis]WDG80008.1 Cro/CI family transcriptional regulator [Pseudomonas chlororaphis]WDG86939.1 Cro/CI family transcriptional regulator [Pseudomonas chlororaphis]
METLTLGDFVRKIGQARVARALGVKPASIAKAIQTRRNILVTIADDGSCVAQETRSFPSHGSVE